MYIGGEGIRIDWNSGKVNDLNTRTNTYAIHSDEMVDRSPRKCLERCGRSTRINDLQ